jgi:hypothetical protein
MATALYIIALFTFEASFLKYLEDYNNKLKAEQLQ